MDKNCEEDSRKSKRSLLYAAAVFVVSAAVYFALCAFRNADKDERIARIGAQSCEQAADDYFRAFGECDGELYVYTISPDRYEKLLELFDSETELFESYNGQFEDERDYFTALYGGDFRISYEIKSSEKTDIPVSGANEARRMEIKAEIRGSKARRVSKGALTFVNTDDGWYVYAIDFKENFW